MIKSFFQFSQLKYTCTQVLWQNTLVYFVRDSNFAGDIVAEDTVGPGSTHGPSSDSAIDTGHAKIEHGLSLTDSGFSQTCVEGYIEIDSS